MMLPMIAKISNSSLSSGHPLKAAVAVRRNHNLLAIFQLTRITQIYFDVWDNIACINCCFLFSASSALCVIGTGICDVYFVLN